jgi:hypothetical protein
MIVDGRTEVVGSDPRAAQQAVERATKAPHGALRIDLEAEGVVQVTASDLPPIARGDHADILLAVTEDGLRTAVRSGENHGRTLTHAAVARALGTIGEATAGTASARTTLTLDHNWDRGRLSFVAFVQERRSRTVLATAIRHLEPTTQ